VREATSVSNGFQVVTSELLTAAGTFEKESRALSGAVPGGGLHAPDGGDGAVNAALSDALRAASLTTGQFAAVIGDYGRKLSAAHERYEATEKANAGLARQITGLAGMP
jgi:uncharacterized protein DUF6317